MLFIFLCILIIIGLLSREFGQSKKKGENPEYGFAFGLALLLCIPVGVAGSAAAGQLLEEDFSETTVETYELAELESNGLYTDFTDEGVSYAAKTDDGLYHGSISRLAFGKVEFVESSGTPVIVDKNYSNGVRPPSWINWVSFLYLGERIRDYDGSVEFHVPESSMGVSSGL